MHFQRFYGRNEDDTFRHKTTCATLNIEGFFHAAVGAEARFSDDVAGVFGAGFACFGAGEFEGDFVCDDGTVSVGYVGEGAGVDEYRRALLLVARAWT
jgi:hypothetical protein